MAVKPSPVDAEILHRAMLPRVPEAREPRYFVTEEFIRGAEVALANSENPQDRDLEVLQLAIATEILRQREEAKEREA